MTGEHLTDGWEPYRPGVLLEEPVLADGRLADEPDLPAVGVFSDMSRPPAQALGFLPLTRFTLWHRPGPPD